MACLVGVAALLGGCGSSAVDVDTPRLGGPAASTCSALVRALPQTVDDAERRSIEPADAPAAAWGDPPIVLRCGVPMPEEFDEFAPCQEVNGVGWFVPEEQITGSPQAVTMTTIGRAVNVEVSLPPEHWPPAAAMVDLAAAIERTVTETQPCV